MGAYGRYNFVPNESGVEFVPFARLSYASGEIHTTSTTTAKMTRLRFGIAWFANDHVAIEGYLESAMREYSNRSSDSKFNGLSANGTFAVYF